MNKLTIVLGFAVKVLLMIPVLFLICFVWLFILPTLVVGFTWAFIKAIIRLFGVEL